MEIVQQPNRVLIIYEFDHFLRQVWMDGRAHVKDLPPTWMGDSIGKWDGDTLVIDSTGFNDKTWLDRAGHPHSEDLHVVERLFNLVNAHVLQDDLTIMDPNSFTKPWKTTIPFELRPTGKFWSYTPAQTTGTSITF